MKKVSDALSMTDKQYMHFVGAGLLCYNQFVSLMNTGEYEGHEPVYTRKHFQKLIDGKFISLTCEGEASMFQKAYLTVYFDYEIDVYLSYRDARDLINKCVVKEGRDIRFINAYRAKIALEPLPKPISIFEFASSQ